MHRRSVLILSDFCHSDPLYAVPELYFFIISIYLFVRQINILRNAFQFEEFTEHLCCANVIFASTASHDVLICVSRIYVLVFSHSFLHRCKIAIGVHISMAGFRKFVIDALEALLCNKILPQGQNVGI